MNRAWGEVYKAIEKSTGRQVAIKMMTLSQLDEQVIEEILIMKANHHRNVVTYIDSFLLVDKDLLWVSFKEYKFIFDYLG